MSGARFTAHLRRQPIRRSRPGPSRVAPFAGDVDARRRGRCRSRTFRIAAAQARGGFAAAAAFFERSVALTMDPARRSDRALRAAESKRVAGALNSALGLAAIAESGPLDDVQRAQLDVLRGRVAFAGNRGNDAAPLMLKAASRLEHVDLRLARETYLDALTAALFAGRLAVDASAQVVARAALAAPRSDEPARASELLLEGLALLITDSYKSGTAALQQAMTAFRSDDVTGAGAAAVGMGSWIFSWHHVGSTTPGTPCPRGRSSSPATLAP